jgi:hypothetical protein
VLGGVVTTQREPVVPYTCPAPRLCRPPCFAAARTRPDGHSAPPIIRPTVVRAGLSGLSVETTREPRCSTRTADRAIESNRVERHGAAHAPLVSLARTRPLVAAGRTCSIPEPCAPSAPLHGRGTQSRESTRHARSATRLPDRWSRLRQERTFHMEARKLPTWQLCRGVAFGGLWEATLADGTTGAVDVAGGGRRSTGAHQLFPEPL